LNDSPWILIALVILSTIGFFTAFRTKDVQKLRSRIIGSASDPHSQFDYWLFKIIGFLMFAIGALVIIARILNLLI
jgi:hypothetical protein